MKTGGLTKKIKDYGKNVRAYFLEVTSLQQKASKSLNILQIIRFFPGWQSSLNSKRSPLLDEQPWLTYAATQYLSKLLNEKMHVYEYGVGGSSLYFLQRVKEVVSIEHDPEWLKQVLDIVKNRGYTNWSHFLIEPTIDSQACKQNASDPDGYISDDAFLLGKSFRKYASNIDEFANGYFDLILIDGRARPSCFKHAVNKVKENGIIVLDNAERDYYRYIHENMKERAWKKHSFYGPGPYVHGFWETCIWENLDKNN